MRKFLTFLGVRWRKTRSKSSSIHLTGSRRFVWSHEYHLSCQRLHERWTCTRYVLMCWVFCQVFGSKGGLLIGSLQWIPTDTRVVSVCPVRLSTARANSSYVGHSARLPILDSSGIYLWVIFGNVTQHGYYLSLTYVHLPWNRIFKKWDWFFSFLFILDLFGSAAPSAWYFMH